MGSGEQGQILVTVPLTYPLSWLRPSAIFIVRLHSFQLPLTWLRQSPIKVCEMDKCGIDGQYMSGSYIPDGFGFSVPGIVAARDYVA